MGLLVGGGKAMAQDIDAPGDGPEEGNALEAYQESFDEVPVTLDMLPIPTGSVVVHGEDGPEEVDVGPFWMSQTEVPWEVFDLYAFGDDEGDAPGGDADADAILRPSNPYGAPDRGYGHRGYAAISMTGLVAGEFARWLSARTGRHYRLPTEAEWEYACRAGREDPIPEDSLGTYGWYWDNAFDATRPVGELQPNAFGLHDMIGNASEWCVGLDGKPLACGGSFMDEASKVGCDARKIPSRRWQETDPQIPKSRFWLTDGPFMGFRIIREP